MASIDARPAGPAAPPDPAAYGIGQIRACLVAPRTNLPNVECARHTNATTSTWQQPAQEMSSLSTGGYANEFVAMDMMKCQISLADEALSAAHRAAIDEPISQPGLQKKCITLPPVRSLIQ